MEVFRPGFRLRLRERTRSQYDSCSAPVLLPVVSGPVAEPGMVTGVNFDGPISSQEQAGECVWPFAPVAVGEAARLAA